MSTLSGGEHIHLGLHLGPASEAGCARFLAVLCDAPWDETLRLRTETGQIARSAEGGWLLQRCLHGLRGARDWSAYAAKGQDGTQGTTAGKRLGGSTLLNRNARKKSLTT